MLNTFVIVGRLVKDIEDEEIRLAVNRPYKNEEGIYETDFIDIQIKDIFNNVKEYCKKGDLVGVKGRLETKDDKLQLVADKLTFLSTKKGNE